MYLKWVGKKNSEAGRKGTFDSFAKTGLDGGEAESGGSVHTCGSRAGSGCVECVGSLVGGLEDLLVVNYEVDAGFPQ